MTASLLPLLRQICHEIVFWRIDLLIFTVVAAVLAVRHRLALRHFSDAPQTSRLGGFALAALPLAGLAAAEAAGLLLSGAPAVKGMSLRLLILGAGGLAFHYQLRRREMAFAIEETEIQRDEMAATVTGAVQSANRAEQSKHEFLGLVSHELATPMTAIGDLTRLLGDQPLTPESRRLVHHLAQEEIRLAGMIDDLLDYVRLESGRLELRRAPFCPVESARRALEHVAAAAEAKHLELRLEAQFQEPLQLLGDETRLRRILRALLDNAVKFTPEGMITLQLSWEPAAEPSRRGQLRASVTDTGVGIPAGDLDRLFQPFAPLNAAHTRPQRGSGLGLAITRRLVNLMGGNIRCTSAPGQGSCFELDLPLAQLRGSEEPAAPAPANTGLRILVVDDLETNRLVLGLLLQRHGFRPEVVASGEEALERLGRETYDAILLDLHMPGMGGYETSRRIRQLEADRRRTPIIALTASISRQTFGRCVDAGMDGQLQKPLDIQRLRKAIADRNAAAESSPDPAGVARPGWYPAGGAR